MRIRFLYTEAFRLSAIYAGIFAASVLALGLVVFILTDRAFRDQIVQFSYADVAAVKSGYGSEGAAEAREVVDQIMAAPGGSDFFLLQKDGKRVTGNLPPMAPQAGTLSLPGFARGHDILGTGAMIAPGLYVYAGSDLYRIHAAEKGILRALVWLFLVAFLVAAAGGALVSRSFLRRSDAMARACRAIMDGDLKARIPVRGTHDELDRLAGTINEMLDRIADLMENLRQVTNDIAHDLRTPVSHLRQRLERAREEAQGMEMYTAGLTAAIEKTDEILQLFAALLRIAQIEGGARRAAFRDVELSELLMHLGAMFGAVAEQAGDRLKIAATDHAVIRGDRELLVQLFSNLIENAILHTPPGTQITLSLSAGPEGVIVTVRDDGPGVPPEEHARLFQRLYRREASRSQPGYGLGLSMAAAIAGLHGGRIVIAEQDEPGLSVAVSFPSSSPFPSSSIPV